MKKNKKRKAGDSDEGGDGKNPGAAGPGGEFVEFPEYDGEEEPHENKKAFTLFCKNTRREVKASLDPSERKKKDHVNSILKDRWYALSEDEKHVWKEWEVWDAKRYEHQCSIYENRQSRAKKAKSNSPPREPPKDGVIPKKSIPKKDSAFSIPKKRK